MTAELHRIQKEQKFTIQGQTTTLHRIQNNN